MVTTQHTSAVKGSVRELTREVFRWPVIVEQLDVTKTAVDRGGFRFSERVDTHEQLVDELLNDESVDIERCPVNPTVADGALPGVRREGDATIVPVLEWRLVTVTVLLVFEDVCVTRTKAVCREPPTDVLRREHIDVERLSEGQTSSAETV